MFLDNDNVQANDTVACEVRTMNINPLSTITKSVRHMKSTLSVDVEFLGVHYRRELLIEVFHNSPDKKSTRLKMFSRIFSGGKK